MSGDDAAGSGDGAARATVLLERRGPVAVLRLDRPARRNALDTATTRALNAHLRELAADDELRAVVLSTTDPTALCAGADLAERLDAAGALARMAAYTELYSLVEAFPVALVVVAVGDCVGAGAELVAGADLRVGGDNVRLAWAGARLGVPVGPARLGPLVGTAAARDLVLTGRRIGADEARALGLLQRLVPAAEAEAVAIATAEAIAANHPRGVRALKALFRQLDATEVRVSTENAALLAFQSEGEGIPRPR